MTALDESICALRAAVTREPGSTSGDRWSRRVRRRLGRVRRLLTAPTQTDASPEDAWLSPRADREKRQREALLARIVGWEPSLRAPVPLEAGPGMDRVRGPLLRLAADLEHHQRRSRALAFDAVAMDLGGSE